MPLLGKTQGLLLDWNSQNAEHALELFHVRGGKGEEFISGQTESALPSHEKYRPNIRRDDGGSCLKENDH